MLPGLALIRSIFEAMLRAHWIAVCATDAEVDQFAEDHSFDIMSRCDPDRIDEAFQTGGFFRQAKNDAWKSMNACTHGGLGRPCSYRAAIGYGESRPPRV